MNKGIRQSGRARGLFKTLFVFLAFAFFTLASYTVHAAAYTCIWSGGGADNNWSTAGNWTSCNSTYPNNGANTFSATFNGTSTKHATIDVSVTVTNLNINSGYTGTITQSAALALKGNFAYNAGTFSSTGQTVTFNGGSAASQTLTCSGSFNSTGNANPTVVISGGSSTQSFTLSSGCTLYQGNISTSGTISIAGTMNQSGTWSSNSLTVSNGGTLTRATNDTLDLNNTGHLTVVGTFNQAASTAITMTGDYSRTGTITNLATATITFDGGAAKSQSINDCSGSFNSTGNTAPTVNISGGSSSQSFTLSSGCTLYQGNISTSGDINIAGTMNQNGTWSSNSLTVSDGGTLTRATNDTLDLNNTGNLTVAGTFNQAASTAITMTGDYSRTGTITNLATATITFDGGAAIAQTISNCSGSLNSSDNTNPTIDYKGGSSTTSFTIPANCTVYMTTNATNAGDIIVNGTLYVTNAVKGDALTVNSGGNFGFNGAAVTLNSKTLNAGSIVTFRGDGDGAADTYSINSFTTAPSNLVINSIDGTTDIFNLGATVIVGSDLTVTSGILSLNGSNLTVTGTLSNDATIRLQGGETVTATNDTNSGTVEYVGTSTYTELKFGDSYYNLTINGSGGAWGLDAALDVNNNFNLEVGSLETNGNNITIGGNWSKSGTFTHENNTVTFDTAGTTSTISGSTTFNNFTSTTALKPIIFTAGTTQTIAGTLTLTGTAGNLISLRSSSNGSAWNLDANGTKNVSYVDVKDSDATLSSSMISPSNSTDSGNNTNWFPVTAGITVGAISGNTTEAGGTATFTVVLDGQPSADVVIGISSNDTGEGTVSPASLTFTSVNWATPQTVTVTGVNDDLDDGDIAYNVITAAATSADGNYNGLNGNDVTATNTDNDASGFTVSAISGATAETGSTATFTVVLNAQPTADVSTAISSDDTGEGTVSPASLTFTSVNWATPQTVTVTGVNDDLDDGNIAFNIVTAAATSGDSNYNNINPANVTVTNNDNDTSGFTVSAISGATTEASGTATFTVVLNAQPTADVSTAISSDDTGEGTVSPASLTFTSVNWATPQTVTVTGVNDDLDDGDIAFNIVTAAATSGDSNYNNINPANAAVTNTDNDTAGFTIGAISGHTTEAGGTATFTIKLTSEPTADVSMGISSDDTGEGTVSPASVTFTSVNWNSNQTVTVTGVDDGDVDGNVVFNILTAAATSGDSSYNTLNPANVAVTNDDDDTDAGITVGAISGNTTEAGGTATFTVVLDGAPSDDVVIGISSDDTSEGTVSAATLTFTTGNWATPQTVTVTGVNDDLDDGDINYNIITAAATSNDTNYNTLNAANVSATNTDNDTSGFTVSAISGATTESASTATFTVVLTAQPTADVSTGISSDDTGEGTVSPASLTFTSVNWATPQTVTVTGVNDDLDDGDIAFNIITAAATSGDSNYNNINPANVAVTNNDNDASGFTVSAISGNTTEAGGTATFTVVLTAQPSADVSTGISSDDTGEGTVSPASLTFTSANWATPQTVTVTGVNDDMDDGDIAFNIITAAATSGDSNYNAVNPANTAVTNTDNDTAGFTIGAISGHTTEAGGTATFTLKLASQPTDDVTIGISSDDTGEGTVSPSSLTFTSVNWNSNQTVTVTGVDDIADDGDVAFSIVTAAAVSNDTSYNNLNPANVAVTNDDDDNAPGITVSVASGNTTEAGGTATFTVVLDSEPSDNVAIGISSDDTSEGTVSAATLTFTSLNWDTPQTITVTGVNDSLDDGDINYHALTAAAVSNDSNYNTMDAADVDVTNTDNDTSGFTIGAISGNTAESGTTATFTLKLTAEPTADVTIGISSDDTGEGTVSPSSLTFTSVNWNSNQTVTVTGVNDSIIDGNIAFNIMTAAAVSADTNYNNLNPANVAVTNEDNDAASITITQSGGTTVTSEAGGTDSFTIVLDSQPTDDVVIGITSDDTGEGTVSPASITFTTGDWNTPQTITVTGVNDDLDDGDINYNIVTAAAVSNDSNFNNVNAADVSASNTDNDTVGFTIGAISGNTTEAGGTATFTFKLASQPTDDVVIGISSDDTGEGTVSPNSLTFTSVNWNSNQTITVTGVNDSLVDGDIAFNIVTAAAVSNDTGYNNQNPANVGITNDDNDTAGITVTQSGGTTVTTEAGGTDTFTVVLTAQPANDVVIGISSDDTGEGTVSAASLTFTNGNWNTPQTITVTGVNDSIVDGNVGYNIVTAASVSDDTNFNGYDASDVSATNNDNDTAGVTVSAISGNTTEAATTATFTVVLTAQPASNVTIDLTSTDTGEGTVSPATLTFTNGNWNTPQTVTITGVDDELADGNQNFTITTSVTDSADGTFDNLAVADANVTNEDDEAAASLSVNDISVNEGNSGTVTATFTVTLSTASADTVTVDYATANSNATAGSDYTAGSGTLTFTSGQTSKTVNVSVAGDTVDEVNETFNLVLSNASVTVSDDTGVATITDNDNATISLADETVGEADGTATVTVTLATTSDRTVTVDYATSNATATAGSDYTTASGTLTFTAGQTSKTFNITVADDSVDEANETITVTLTNASNTTISDATGSVTITDDDGSPSLSINNATVAENVVSGKATFTVTLSEASEQSVTVDYATANGTATAGSDYTVASGTLTFTAGQTSKTIDVTISDDGDNEANETFTVGLSNATNSTISDNSGLGTINNDDTATLSVADVTADEEDGTATVTVTLSNTSAQSITVDYATSNGTATATSDYTAASGTLTFSAGQTSKTFNITLASDTLDENNETITVTLSNPTNTTISDATGVVTITDDDTSPSLSIDNITVTENDDPATATFTVTLSSASGRSVTVDYATSNGTASSASDYTAASGTLTFTAGETSKTIDVSFADDGVNEANETFNMNLSNASGATISDNQGVATMNNDDSAPGLSVADVTIDEGDGTATVTVTMASSVGQNVTVDYATSNGTATATSDYTATSGTLTFSAGETSKTFDITISDDATDEADENIAITLSNATVASISDGSALVTITDNDSAPTISIDDVSPGESGNASFTVTLSAASGKAISVNYATANGTATSGNDYSSTSGTLTFSAGETTKNITVPILSDAIDENNETINANLSGATNATISDNQGVATITDDDATPTVTFAASTSNGDESSTAPSVTVNLSAASGLTATVDYAVTGGTASGAGTDYTLASGTLTFAAGETSKNITLSVENDATNEDNETIVIAISNPSNTTLGATTSHTYTITDNDSPGVSVTQSGGTTTATEGGSGDTFTVVLNTEPTNDVTVDLTPGANVATDVPDLTFTSANWSTPQTVTVSADNDSIAEGNHNDTIGFSVTSSDNDYDGASVTAVTVAITDNDSAGVSITQSSGSTAVTEGGATDTYTIVLTSEPTQDVTVAISSSAQVTRSSASVVFTNANWNNAQTITVTSVNDSVAEGSHDATLNHTVTSSDTTYNGISTGSVSITITDNDSAGISVTQSGGTTTITEGGATDTYTIVLTSEPTADVVITVVDTAQATSNADTLTFTSANWNSAQTITVTAANDAVAEGSHNTTITHTAASSDTNYQGISIGSVVTSITDNDSAGISVTETGGATTATEGGSTDTYTVVLTSEPTNDVVITLSNSSQTTTTPVLPLTFTNANWNTPKTVTVTAANDDVAEGAHNATITMSAESSDVNYNGFSIGTISVAITDNDAAGISVAQSGDTTTVTEGSNTDTYTVVLTSQPTANVTFNMAAGSQLSLGSSALTFTTGNWASPQSVTVTAQNDSVSEGPHNGTISFTVASSDVNYNAISVSSVVADITDNDSAGITVAASGGTTELSESGTSDSYTVVLSSQPTSDVTVTIVSSDQAEADVETLVFTSGNWNNAQTITLTALEDLVDEGLHNTTITHTVSSSDTNFNGISIGSIVAAITDNDNRGIIITESDDSTDVTEGGTTDSYTLVLATKPRHDVTITITSNDQITGTPESVVFTPVNWNSAQTITITAINDAVVEGAHTAETTFTVTSDDDRYDALEVTPVTINIEDNDTAEESDTLVANILGKKTVQGGSTQTFASQDTGATSYLWTIEGDGTIVGSTTNPAVDVLFSDVHGTATLTLTVGNGSQTLSDSINVIVAKNAITTSDERLFRYDGVKVTGTTTSGSAIVNDSQTVSGRGDVSVIDFDTFRFYGLTDAPLTYKIDAENNVVYIGEPSANNNTGSVYRIPVTQASGDIQAWNLPSYVKTRAGSAEGDMFGYNFVLFDDKIAIHAPGLRIISVYSKDLTNFLALVNEADNVPLGTNIFMQAEDVNNDDAAELFVGGKYTNEDVNSVEESLGLSLISGLALDITMPSEGEVKTVEGSAEWESDVSLNEADATFNATETFYSSDVGDFNGDGTNDLVVSSMNSCSAYVFFGTESIEGKNVEDANLTITGINCSGGLFGYQTVMGEVSGDSYEDIVISAPLGGSIRGGSVFVVFGFNPNSQTTIDLADTTTGNSITIESSQANGFLGAHTLALSDTDGDGVLDIIMSEESSVGTSTLVYSVTRNIGGGSGEQGGEDGPALSASGGGCSLNENSNGINPIYVLLFTLCFGVLFSLRKKLSNK